MCISYLFLISLLLGPSAWADSSGSVFFIDNAKYQYLRTPPLNDVAKSHAMLLPEVGAAVSILLGFAPLTTLSADSSSKLNAVLAPNPFDRPRAVFMLEVTGVDDPHLIRKTENTILSNAFRSDVVPHSDKGNIQLSDEDEISVVYLDDPLSDCTDKEISDFASWLSGSYEPSAVEALSGVLSIPLENGMSLSLHMSKKSDRDFTSSLLALSHNIRRAVDLHEDLSQSIQRHAELLIGHFNGIKALQEQYGLDVAQQGMGMLLAMLSKMFDSLQQAYKGQIVGVILFNGRPHPESESSLNLMYTSRSSPRWLAETEGFSNATLDDEVLLVRRTLAWLTGVILLIATLLGIYFLLNMPLTRDTLLYSNVKLE